MLSQDRMMDKLNQVYTVGFATFRDWVASGLDLAEEIFGEMYESEFDYLLNWFEQALNLSRTVRNQARVAIVDHYHKHEKERFSRVVFMSKDDRAKRVQAQPAKKTRSGPMRRLRHYAQTLANYRLFNGTADTLGRDSPIFLQFFYLFSIFFFNCF
jgi:hypothetical protein